MTALTLYSQTAQLALEAGAAEITPTRLPLLSQSQWACPPVHPCPSHQSEIFVL